MPYLELMVNIQVGAEILGKPEAYITTSITYNKTLTFAGTLDPAFALTIISLGNLSAEKNERYSAALAQFFKDKLGIASDRGYINFHDPGNGYLGFKGTTFATIFGKA
ncbi:Tautomerase/MIF superfamily [Favolaschia claudopus]|uniref:L-dopachrome isomerase n=1 Tax=Favolaschia claudopus TaxID=2862362 RepID=A0AAW0CA25_9AGAR